MFLLKAYLCFFFLGIQATHHYLWSSDFGSKYYLCGHAVTDHYACGS